MVDVNREAGGMVNREQQRIIEYLRTENQILREKLGKKRILLNDDLRRRLAAKGKILGRNASGLAGCCGITVAMLRERLC